MIIKDFTCIIILLIADKFHPKKIELFQYIIYNKVR